MDIRTWLRGLGLERYADAFRSNEIDELLLPTLTLEDLKDLGVEVVGHRRKLMNAIEALGQGGTIDTQFHQQTPSHIDQDVASKAERRQLTVLFCDLVGSTALSNQLDPEEMREVILRFQKAVNGAAVHFSGHIAKFLGDGVLAYFGWPQAHEDDAERAVRAAQAMIRNVADITATNETKLACRVGVATGLVVVGDLVSGEISEEAAVSGNIPNLAARLQSVAESGEIVISSGTRKIIGNAFKLSKLEAKQLKGFDKPVRCWSIVDDHTTETRFEVRGLATTVLVGRQHELGLLKERTALALDGEGQCVLIEGEAGIGKSRLVKALMDDLAHLSVTLAPCQCSPFHSNTALHPLLERLKRAASFSPDDSDEAKLEKLGQFLRQGANETSESLALLAPLLSIDSGDHFAPGMTLQRRNQRLNEILFAIIERHAAEQPVIMIIEDAHWIDPSTSDFIEFAIPRIATIPAMLIITFRPDLDPPWPSQRHVTKLSLNALAKRHAGELVNGVLGNKAIQSEWVDHVVTKADGIPLFIEELTKLILETTSPDNRNHADLLLDGTASDSVPSTLQDSLLARLDRLDQAKSIAQDAAAIGRDFDRDLLAAISPLAKPDLERGLEELVQSELVFRHEGSGSPSYTFKHALVRDVAYQSLLKPRRRQLHASIANQLSMLDAKPEIVAYHATHAGLIEQASEQWLTAGELALSQASSREALSHLQKGLDLTVKQVPATKRATLEARLNIAMGHALIALKGPVAESEAAFQRARQLCRDDRDSMEWFRATYGLFFCHYFQARVAQTDMLSEELLKSASPSRPNSKVFDLHAHHARWTSCNLQGRFAETREHGEVGLQLYVPERDHASTCFIAGHDGGVCCRFNMGLSLLALGYPEQSLTTIDEGLALARRLEHAFSLAYMLLWRAIVDHLRAEPDKAQASAGEAETFARSQNLPVVTEASRIIGSWSRWALNKDVRAKEEIAASIANLEGLGAKLRHPFYLALYGRICNRLGDVASGLAAIDRGIACAKETGESWYLAELYRYKGELVRSAGKSEAATAEALYEQARAVARKQQAKWFELSSATSLAQLYADRRERQRGVDILAPVYESFSEGFDAADLKLADALLRDLM